MSKKIKIYKSVVVSKDIAEDVLKYIKDNGGEVVKVEPATRFDINPTHPNSIFNVFAEEHKLYTAIIYVSKNDKQTSVNMVNTAIRYSL